MKLLFNSLLLICISFLIISCNKDCATNSDAGNPDRSIKLKDKQGNDLWFGPTAQYDPSKVIFEHQNGDTLSKKVDSPNQAVMLKFPENDAIDEDIYMYLGPGEIDTLTYATLVYSTECVQQYELSYVKFNGQQVCVSCGDTQYNPNRFINIVKD